MERRKFTREFKLEAVRLIKERGVSYAQASHDLSVHQSQLRSWVKALADDPQQAFPGQGQMKPEQPEVARSRHPGESRGLLREAPGDLAGRAAKPRLTCSITSNASKRRHSTIGYLSPMEFERQAGLA